jgi:hypothetical protein
MIREVILTGGLIYIGIMVIQAADQPSVAAECLAAGSILAAAVAFYYYDSHGGMHRAETAAFWAAVFLFVIYWGLKYGGLV